MTAAMEAAAARAAEYERSRTPVRVTEEEWDDSLNVLPPIRWHTEAGAETFTVSEPVTGTLYSRYVRIGDKRWVMVADIRDSVHELVRRCRAAEGGAA